MNIKQIYFGDLDQMSDIGKKCMKSVQSIVGPNDTYDLITEVGFGISENQPYWAIADEMRMELAALDPDMVYYDIDCEAIKSLDLADSSRLYMAVVELSEKAKANGNQENFDFYCFANNGHNNFWKEFLKLWRGRGYQGAYCAQRKLLRDLDRVQHKWQPCKLARIPTTSIKHYMETRIKRKEKKSNGVKAKSN